MTKVTTNKTSYYQSLVKKEEKLVFTETCLEVILQKKLIYLRIIIIADQR